MIEKRIEKFKKDKDKELMTSIVAELRRIQKYKNFSDFDKRYDDLKKEFIKKNRSEALVIEILFGIRDILKAERFLEAHRGQRIENKKFKEIMRTLTEWQFMATHLMIYAGKNRKFCENFWSKYGEIYRLFSKDNPRGHKKGIIGQVAVYRIMKELGLNPRLSHPDEDAFEKTDLWVYYPKEEKNIAIQTKYTSRVKKPIFISTDEINYPAILQQEKEKNMYFAHKDIEEMFHLKQRCQKKNEKGFYVALPDGSVDNLTGQPKEWILEEIKKEFDRIKVSN
ncbi:hypothetical protein J7K86_00565 [bacterium]|nr:hypothetical protein [bacterium]